MISKISCSKFDKNICILYINYYMQEVDGGIEMASTIDLIHNPDIMPVKQTLTSKVGPGHEDTNYLNDKRQGGLKTAIARL